MGQGQFGRRQRTGRSSFAGSGAGYSKRTVELRPKQRQKSFEVPFLIAILASVAAGGAMFPVDGVGGLQDAVTAVGLSPSCDIKGNVSIDTGERIYHVRGQEYYDDTRIRTDYGGALVLHRS
jgi:hypothetical protein